MKKVEKMSKSITTEELKTISEQQTKLNELLRNIGVMEVQKTNMFSAVKDASDEIEATKKELEDKYGQINIDLKDGSFTEIEKEDEK